MEHEEAFSPPILVIGGQFLRGRRRVDRRAKIDIM